MPPRLSPLLPFATAFVCGILCASCGLGWWGIPVSALLALTALWMRRRVVGGALLGLSLGMLAVAVRSPHTLHADLDGRVATWAGDISEVRQRGNGTILTVDVDSCDGQRCPPFKARVMAFGEKPGDIGGYHILFRGRMRPLRRG
ncbi:MAG: hypothetical protein K2H87_08605, partial [Duncaniella sp.]|nr:hypothetical protein [Duncaniella sp.]